MCRPAVHPYGPIEQLHSPQRSTWPSAHLHGAPLREVEWDCLPTSFWVLFKRGIVCQRPDMSHSLPTQWRQHPRGAGWGEVMRSTLQSRKGDSSAPRQRLLCRLRVWSRGLLRSHERKGIIKPGRGQGYAVGGKG